MDDVTDDNDGQGILQRCAGENKHVGDTNYHTRYCICN